MRVCALVAVIACGVLAVPATARSDPFSTAGALQADAAVTDAQVVQQANAAVADAQALASQELTEASSVASKAAADEPASPVSPAGVEREAAKTVSDALASVGTAATSPTATPPPRTQRPPPPPATHRNRHRPAPRRQRSATPVAPPTRAVPAVVHVVPAAAPPSAGERARGSARPARGGGSRPHRPPPLPVPPLGLNGSAEGGGSGTPSSLLVGALAAALLFAFFEFLSRLLPRSAFRKPRRLALPPWHPG